MKNPRIKASTPQILAISFLFGFAMFFFTYPFIHFWAFVLAISSIGIAIITLHRKQNEKPNQSGLYAIAVVKEIQYEKSDQKTGREIKLFELYPRKLELEEDFLSLKGQNNITISGVAGSGKSVLTMFIIDQLKQFKKIIFQFDPQDHYKEMGIPTLFLKEYAPNVFKDPNSFAEAWETAFQGDATTYRAIPDIVKNIASKSQSWQDFKKILFEEMQQHAKDDIITTGAYNAIARQLSRVYMDKVTDYSLPDNLVISFEDMDIRAFRFYGDWILRTLYKELLQKDSPRAGTMLFIDEASQFRNEEKPVLPSIMALIRKRGAMLMGTQFVSDLKGIRGNAKTQFAFYTNEGEDLDEVKTLSESYHWVIQRLNPYEFVDLAQKNSHEGIFIYKLIDPKPEFKPVQEWKPQEEKEDYGKGRGSQEIDIPKEIVRLLSIPANQQDLAKRFSQEYGKNVEFWKLKLKGYLKIMQMNNEISADLTDYVKFGADGRVYEIRKSIVYHRKGDYSYHDFLVNAVADILFHKGLLPKIQAHGLPLADIMVEPKLAFEIETGSKNGYKIEETKQRVEDFAKEGYKVFVIVPNQEIKRKYVDAGFSNVFTALELKEAEI